MTGAGLRTEMLVHLDGHDRKLVRHVGREKCGLAEEASSIQHLLQVGIVANAGLSHLRPASP
jgi:hypothetical protein